MFVIIFLSALFLPLLIPPCSYGQDGAAILIGSDIDYYPLSFLKEGSPFGFDADLLLEMKKVSSLQFNQSLAPWKKVLSDLREGRLDAVSGIILTGEREENFDFSIPYLEESYTIFAHRDSGIHNALDLPGKVPAILAGDAVVESYIIPNNLSAGKISTKTYSEAFALVAAKEADYTIAPYALGQHIMKQKETEGAGELRSKGRPLFSVQYRIAVAKDNETLLFQINEAISKLQSEHRLQQLQRKWKTWNIFEISSPGNTFLAIRILMIFIVLLLIILPLWILAMGRTVKHKTRELSGLVRACHVIMETLPCPAAWKTEPPVLEGSNRHWKVLENQLDKPAVKAEEGPGVKPVTDQYGNQSWYRQHRISIEEAEHGIAGSLEVLQECTKEFQALEDLRNLHKELAEKNSTIQELMVMDKLSGLFLMHHFLKRIKEELALFDRYNRPFSVILVDIDRFQEIEKSRGFTAGEKAVQTMATVIRESMRKVDFAGRVTGGTFLVGLPHTEKENAQGLGEKICRAVETSGSDLTICCIIGEYSGQGWDAMLNCLEGKLKELYSTAGECRIQLT